MLLYIASIIMAIFIGFNLFHHTSLPLPLKAGGIALVFLASLKYVIYQFVGGAFFAPQLPRGLLLVMEAAYGAFIILFFLLVLYDLYLFGNWLLARAGIPVPQHLPRGAIKLALTGLALALGCWGTWQAVKVPDTRKVAIRLPNLPQALQGMTIAQLTDLHIGPILKKDWLAQVVARTNALNPDLILLTGDYVDGYADEIGEELAPLADLRARYGVWAVTGNHEYYWDMPAWKRALEHLGIPMLENEHRLLQINDETIVLAGIPDLAATKFGLPGPSLEQALSGAPRAVTILMSHQPRHAANYASGADLILSGHTHGGIMFFLEPLISRFNAGFVKGLYPTGGKNVYVSPGTGLWNGFSCRIGVPAEITLLRLETENPATGANDPGA